MFVMTLIHFSILSLKGGAFYNYYHYYADKGALVRLGWKSCTSPLRRWPDGARSARRILEFLGYVVHADRANLANSNVADVANSVINILEKIVFIIVIMCSPMLSKAFGKKSVAVVGFALTAVVSAMFYLPKPTDIGWMIALTVIAAPLPMGRRFRCSGRCSPTWRITPSGKPAGVRPASSSPPLALR